MPPSVLYFAYGSNLPRARLEARLGKVAVSGAGWLRGYQLRFHKRGIDGSGKCDAWFSGNDADEVHGAMFVLSATQLTRLDGFEGAGYACHSVVAHTASGPREVVTYRAHEHAIASGLQPFDWYLALVRHGAHEHGLPGWYRARMDTIESMEDVDTERARHHFDLIESQTPSHPMRRSHTGF